MNGAYLHIATNHLPVVGMPFAMTLLLIGLLRRNRDIIRMNLAALVAIAAITIFVDQTGDSAAKVLRAYRPEITHGVIHAHAEAADYGLAVTEIAGGLALLGLWLLRKQDRPLTLIWLVFAAALLASVSLARVAHLGGLIRHPEISSTPPSTTPLPPAGDEDHHHH